MHRLQTILLAALAATLPGCRWLELTLEDPEEVLDRTELFTVTPANGVWDDEYGRTANPTNCSFAFRLVRQRNGLVVEAQVRDDVIVTDDCPIGSSTCASWNDDTFQCFFDGDNDRSPDARADKGLAYGGEYTMVANGATQSDYSGHPDSFGSLWKGRVFITRHGKNDHTLDYRLWFSWKCLGYANPPADETDVKFGFNACVHDDDDGGRADRALYWKGSPVMPYRDESKFGTITLKGRKKQ